MGYAYELENGQQLVVESDGDDTLVALSSGSEGQQQSQATGFDTGKWSKAPAQERSDPARGDKRRRVFHPRARE
jgi:hypothetical protein